MRSTLRNACIFAAMLLLFAFSATAQNRQQALNLTLLTTSMQTADDTLALTNTYAHVFGTLDVTCPSTATNGCTIEIQVSSQFAYASGANPDTINIGVSGATLPPLAPDYAVVVDSIASCGNNCTWNAFGFQWMQRSVPAGETVTVSVKMRGSSSVGNRTETVQVFGN